MKNDIFEMIIIFNGQKKRKCKFFYLIGFDLLFYYVCNDQVLCQLNYVIEFKYDEFYLYCKVILK